MDESHGAHAPRAVPSLADRRREGWSAPLPEHIPPDTYTPAVMALGITFIAWGVVTTLLITGVGCVLLAVSVGSWIGEVRRGADTG